MSPAIRRPLRPALHGAVVLGLSCVAPQDERIHCDDTLAPAQATFADVKSLVIETESNEKGCSAANCHGADEAEQGYRLDADSVIYDALTTHIESVYAQVATGEMPPEGGERWTADDLRVLRSWYCNGAFADE